MKTNQEIIKNKIEELHQLVQGTKGGLVLAYTAPGENVKTQSVSAGYSMSLAANYIAIQGSLHDDAMKAKVCNCAGCLALQDVANGTIDYTNYFENPEKKMHTFVVETKEDFENALKRILKGDI
ncbi:hypothetical protein [Candidatus Enterococcus ferrettii]|uniref:Uncharacterized protein n=1 Tax=Candidatus Enterococcus ferrettii TaxID=2815324 RepID=A0ABV0EI60_9ENTE|nr:hypothetical protein [Enterococcus sp. 665A]MBO1341850.1 hypothetical protein [Enterococcus sp. 665A]